jgi:hypothetical protein
MEPCPNSHLHGMLKAMKAVGEHAAAAMSFLPETAPDGKEKQKQLNLIRQIYASAEAKARYAVELHGTNPTRDLHERLETYAKEAIELYYELGQLIARSDAGRRRCPARDDSGAWIQGPGRDAR